MAKFCGMIGFAVCEETTPGVWTNRIVEREYIGDTIKLTRSLQTSDQVNDSVSITDQISIMADDFAIANVNSIRYVEYMGAKWKVNSIGPQRPRLVLTLGGLFNG